MPPTRTFARDSPNGGDAFDSFWTFPYEPMITRDTYVKMLIVELETFEVQR